MVDLHPSCNRQIQMKICLGDRGTCKRFYLYPLAALTARSLDEIESVENVSRDRPRAGWTHVVISRGLETNHYRCPLLLSSLAGGREFAPGSYVLPETPREKEGSKPLESGLGLSVSL